MSTAISKLGIIANEEWIHLQWPVYGSELWRYLDVNVRSKLHTKCKRDVIRMLESSGVYDHTGSERRNDGNESNKLHDKWKRPDENVANHQLRNNVYSILQYRWGKYRTRESDKYKSIQ